MFSDIREASDWFPATIGATQLRNSFKVGVLLSHSGIKVVIASHLLLCFDFVISMPPASCTAIVPPSMSHILGAPKMAY